MTQTRDPVAVTYDLDEARFMRACRALWAYRGIGRGGNFVVCAAILGCAVLLIWLGVPGYWAHFLIAGTVLGIGLTVLRDHLWRRYFRTVDKYKGTIQTTVSVSGFNVVTQSQSDQVPWDQFLSFLSADGFLFLIVDQRHFSIIPLDAFDTVSDATRFEGFLADHLKRLPKRHL